MIYHFKETASVEESNWQDGRQTLREPVTPFARRSPKKSTVCANLELGSPLSAAHKVLYKSCKLQMVQCLTRTGRQPILNLLPWRIWT